MLVKKTNYRINLDERKDVYVIQFETWWWIGQRYDLFKWFRGQNLEYGVQWGVWYDYQNDRDLHGVWVQDEEMVTLVALQWC